MDDVVAANAFAGDMDDQLLNNYLYDNIGNLTKDVKEGVDSIYWNVYGKTTQVTKSNGSVIKYTYDASGNRTSISFDTTGKPTKTTWFVRDASGNVISVYVKNEST